MSEREMVSADEAQAMLDGVPDLAEVTAAGQDTLSNAVTGGGRYGAAVQRSGELLGDVERLARTVIALHAIIAQRDAAIRERDEAREALRKLRWGIVANAGRRSTRGLPRWAIVRDVAGVGGTTATAMCVDAGFDPGEVSRG